jgi:hypothetical protein
VCALLELLPGQRAMDVHVMLKELSREEAPSLQSRFTVNAVLRKLLVHEDWSSSRLVKVDGQVPGGKGKWQGGQGGGASWRGSRPQKGEGSGDPGLEAAVCFLHSLCGSGLLDTVHYQVIAVITFVPMSVMIITAPRNYTTRRNLES